MVIQWDEHPSSTFDNYSVITFWKLEIGYLNAYALCRCGRMRRHG